MFSSSVGLVHTLCAVVAIVVGALVLAYQKGTKSHRLLGYSFFLAMLLMNISALYTHAIYSFGPFHWMAIASLMFVSFGIITPVFFRRNKAWIRVHYDFMLWSYVGLIAALFSELMVRIPVIGVVVGGGPLFWVLVIGSSFVTFIVGGYMISKNRNNFM